MKMPDSYFSSLSDVLPSTAIQNIASHFGASERTVLDGVQSSIAAIVNGIGQKANDRGLIDHVVQLASSTKENAVSSALSPDVLNNPHSSVLSGGNQLLTSLFGGRLGALTDALSTQTGLRSAATSSLLALGGTTVLGLLGKKLRDGSLNAGNLPGFMQKEGAALRAYLPAGFSSVAATSPIVAEKIDIDPVIAQSVQIEKHRSVWAWLLPLLLAVLLFGFWLLHPRRNPLAVAAPAPVTPPAMPTITSANGTDLGAMVDTKVCDGSTLRTPERGVEGKLLAFIQDPSRPPDKTSWFDFDRLLFDTDSATLQPQSTEQLDNIAAVLKACPAVHLTIGGYTDNTGDSAHNQKLSQDRADSVVAQLETMGIAADRLRAKGYGDQYPVGDNSTEEGRALNRRISMLVTAK
jgi:OmpA-OmpF porin, OOP family